MFSGPGRTAKLEHFDDPVGPLARAFRKNINLVDIASDSITISNIAILALPMLMNIIPVSFVADLNGLGMFVYVLVTDVFTTLPFLIKGVELIRSSRPNSKVVMAHSAGTDSLGTFQVWASQCRGRDYFRVTGIIFVLVALTALVLGLALEIWARNIMRRRFIEAGKGKLHGPFGNAVLKVTSDGLLGTTETGKEAAYWEHVELEKRREEDRQLRPAIVSVNTGVDVGDLYVVSNRSSSRMQALSE